ncbi:MAG: GGDEF domain-containing protein [Candidatus Parcubacteria bacterium]|nr:GGDEF domain-containing protein [Candidatus Parcubacteria bacterium]
MSPEAIKLHYKLMYAIMSSLNESVHNLMEVLLGQISMHFKADRLGIFQVLKSGEKPKYILCGIVGAKEGDCIDEAYPLEFNFTDGFICYTPTQSVGWDAFISIVDQNNELIAILAVDDTSAAREFDPEQRIILFHIKMIVEEIFKQRNFIEQFRFVDPVLNILNWRGIFWKAKEIELRRKVSPGPLSIAVLDIDHFKDINTTHGHSFGTTCLKAIAKAFLQNMRPSDIIGRWHEGDEFIVIWEQTAEIMKKRLTRIQELFTGLKVDADGHHEIGFGFSAGVVEVKEGETLEEAINRADERLRRAKKTRFTIISDDETEGG